MEDARLAGALRALGDERRLAVLHMLAGGERCACELLEELEVSQPTLSHHMKVLCDAELVTCRREGRWAHYAINDEGLAAVVDAVWGLGGERAGRGIDVTLSSGPGIASGCACGKGAGFRPE